MILANRLAPAAPQRFARFRMIGDRHTRLEEAGQHLSPAIPRLTGLVADGGVAQDVDVTASSALVIRPAKAWPQIIELKCQLVIPIDELRGLFAVFQFDLATA